MSINQFKSRRKAKRIFYSPVTVVALVILIAILARSTWSIYNKYRLSEDRLEQADSQLIALKDQGSGLSQSISQLSTASGTEAVIRTDFRVVKPGESLAVIINTATATATTSTPLSFWQEISIWLAKTF